MVHCCFLLECRCQRHQNENLVPHILVLTKMKSQAELSTFFSFGHLIELVRIMCGELMKAIAITTLALFGMSQHEVIAESQSPSVEKAIEAHINNYSKIPSGRVKLTLTVDRNQPQLPSNSNDNAELAAADFQQITASFSQESLRYESLDRNGLHLETYTCHEGTWRLYSPIGKRLEVISLSSMPSKQPVDPRGRKGDR